MTYESIDPTIRAWVKRHGFTLFERTEGMPGSHRSIYTSSEKGECFQIWIDPPASGVVSIHAADVETRDDEKFEQNWSVPLEELERALDIAVAQVRKWMAR